MRKMISFFSQMIVFLLFPHVAFSQQFNNEGITYEVISEEQSKAMIYKAHRCVQYFDVPYRVKDYSGNFYRVTEISHDAFRNLDCLYVLNLNGVEVLRDGFARRYEDGAMDYFGAFANCRNLEEVVWGDLRDLGDYAFYGCSKLEQVNLKQVEKVGKGAFLDCKGLEKIVLGRNVKQIGEHAFAGVPNLSRIEVLSEIPPVCADDAFLESVFQTVVLWVPAGKRTAYLQTAGWMNFLHVEELPVTGVENVDVSDVEPHVEVKHGVIVIEGVEKGEWVSIYDAGGRPLLQRRSVGKTLYVELSRGRSYWVKVGKKKCVGLSL